MPTRAEIALLQDRKVDPKKRPHHTLYLRILKERGSFDAYLWSWTGGKPVVGRWKTMAEVPARTELSDALARDMKGRGFRFLGSTILYSHLQAVGVVDDHLASCFRSRGSRRRP
jgi:DNA-3-methyladenine glycosylase I